MALSYAIATARQQAVVARAAPRWQQVLAVGLLVILISSSSLLWLALRDSFPALAPGAYAGVIESIFAKVDQTRIYVERAAESNALFTIVLREGWTPQLVSAQIVAGDGTVSSLPLSVVAPGHQLKLVGSSIGDDSYAGTVQDLATGRTGTWTLRELRDQPSIVDQAQLKQFLGLEIELEAAQVQLVMAQSEREKLEGELAKLREFVTDSRALKSRSEQKFAREGELLEQSKQRLKAAQNDAKLLESKLALVERLTPMGRLVLQSRESLERDARWFDAVMKLRKAELAGDAP